MEPPKPCQGSHVIVQLLPQLLWTRYSTLGRKASASLTVLGLRVRAKRLMRDALKCPLLFGKACSTSHTCTLSRGPVGRAVALPGKYLLHEISVASFTGLCSDTRFFKRLVSYPGWTSSKVQDPCLWAPVGSDSRAETCRFLIVKLISISSPKAEQLKAL